MRYSFLCILSLFFVYAVSASERGTLENVSENIKTLKSSNTKNATGRPGRPGCPGDTDPDKAGKFYLPGTKEQCNPSKQDALKAVIQKNKSL